MLTLRTLIFVLTIVLTLAIVDARHLRQSQQPQAPKIPTKADILRGEYGPYRANNDLLFYYLDVRVDPDKKFISGHTIIRFRMLKSDNRIQLDLHSALNV